MTSPSVTPFSPVVPSPPQSPTQLPSPNLTPGAPPPHDRHIRRGQDEYWWALSALLPQGIAWPRWPDSVLQMAVRGLAGIMGWVDGRAADLLERESDPRQTVEMLDSWERIASRERRPVPRSTRVSAPAKCIAVCTATVQHKSRAP